MADTFKMLRSAVASTKEILRGDERKMANRPRLIPGVAAAALLALCLPLVASAQGGYDPWGRNRDRDSRRNRDYGDNGRYGGYGNRNLRDVARRLDDRSGDFQSHLDSALDRSRYDGSRQE